MGIKEAILDIFFPEGITCIICGGEVRYRNRYSLCEDCKFETNSGEICLRCGRAIKNAADYCEDCKNTKYSFDTARSALRYTGGTVRLVYGFKFGGKKYLLKHLAPLLADKLVETGWDADYLAYVPLSHERKRERGYNQAEVLARHVSEALGIPVIDALIKNSHTPYQAKKSRTERFESIKGQYSAARKEEIKKKTIILIDDVLTTAATADECAKTLRRECAEKVYVLTLASALLKMPLA